MLDSETRRRIDSARDILVGKVPDPKSQVEQITIALIYKFMDDMDRQSMEMGGKASFFKGEFEKYGWGNIFNPRMGGIEMLNLYGEAITRMSQNASLPELFRQIFKNAYLPYRDPETLKMFLKTINEFNYDHSEKLGDAFEYLLSVLGSQGDAGQFRTPRHIIDFMVKVIDPQKNETILDPACGTAGFLISAYKHIVQSNIDAGKPLTAQEKQLLYDNFTGYDISPDMVRLSLVNLYLHGFIKPNVHEYDTLASEERWNDYADVILANPPFMSPKGGIMPHKRFSVQSSRSEVLFVDYMAEHLTPNGRAAIIVPEGIIFQSANAYKQLRKYLVENNYLWAVVSLPAGVFNPYAAVKTSILLIDKELSKRTDKILFLKIENDGTDLGAQRNAIEKNDIPMALETLINWKQSLIANKNVDDYSLGKIFTIAKSILAKTGEYNLTSERYREAKAEVSSKHEMVSLSEIIDVSGEKVRDRSNTPIMSITMKHGLIDQDEKFKKRIASEDISNYKLVKKNELVVGFPIDEGVLGFQTKYIAAAVSPAYDIWKLKFSGISIPYFERILRSPQARELFITKMRGTANRRRTIAKSDFLELKIPLPPLEIQQQIVDEIAACQRVIDGARQVVENWKPDLEFELEQERKAAGVEAWEYKKIGEVCDFIDYRGKTPNKSDSGVRLITAKNVKMGLLNEDPKEFIADYDSWMTRGIPKKGDVLFTTEGPLGNVAIINIEDEKFAVGQRIITLHSKENIVHSKYLAYALMSPSIQAEIEKLSTGSTVKGILARYFREINIPLPPLDFQQEIANRIESELQSVESCRVLIIRYEEKIQKIISRVWEG